MNPLEALSERLKLVRNRWKFGIEHYIQKTERVSRELAACSGLVAKRKVLRRHGIKEKTIRSAVWGDIRLLPDEIFLLDSFYVQRLRGVSHMGLLHFVYPDARHTRFDHSLGVLAATKQLMACPEFRRALGKTEKERDNICATISYAALLHDIGHGPFSHWSEDVLGDRGYGVDTYFRPGPATVKYHERKAAQLICDTDNLVVRQLGCEVSQYGLCNILKLLLDDENAPNAVAAHILGDSDAFPQGIVNGPLDVDKFDYFCRDAYYTGYGSAGIDVSFVTRSMTVKDGQVAIKENAVTSVLKFLANRPAMYHSVAFHPVVRLVHGMLTIAMDLCMRVIDDGASQCDFLFCLDCMDDNDLISVLEAVSCCNAPEQETPLRILRENLARMRSRELFKKYEIIPLDQAIEDWFGIPRTLTEQLEDFLRLEKDPPRFWYYTFGENGSEEAVLAHMDFEMRTLDSVKSQLDSIRVIKENGTINLREWISERSSAGFDAYRMYLYTTPRLFGRALIAGPGHLDDGSRDIAVKALGKSEYKSPVDSGVISKVLSRVKEVHCNSV